MPSFPTPRCSPLARRRAKTYPLSRIDGGGETLQLLGSLRFATGIQLQRALFARTSATERQARHRATRTLRRLFDSDLLNRVPVFAPSAETNVLSRQLVHTLSASGARAIGVEPRWARQRAPRPQAVLGHDFWLVEVAVLALESCPKPLVITRWWDDRVLAARQRRGALHLPNVPDALLVIHHATTGKDFPCLIELDLGTESVQARSPLRRDLARKVQGYLGYDPARFRQEFQINGHPVVLIICQSEQRLAHLRALTQRLGGAGRFWFCPLAQLQRTHASPSPHAGGAAGLDGPFWASSWQTAANDQLRSLATRCGVQSA